MQDFIARIVQWLHAMGIHPDADATAAVGSAAGQVGDAVSHAAAPARSR